MAADDVGVARKVTPIASVWCRQVDNEAESPGYTAIPDEFPGRRETLETIRIVGNLTINVADTHDYWDPAPTQSLSFYPNLFLYPAASGRYTCVGRMFLSTEDRPRLGMKTLVFSTAELFETADFGGTIIRAHATMDGRAAVRRPAVQPDPSVYQIVGEGFLFHRGSTEPVVVVASDQWEAVCGAVLQVLRAMPSSLVALGAFLVFPYFLPASKVDMHEFAEQLPLALAVMRVPRSEAAGERHEKRIKGWADLPVTLRDLTRPLPTSRTRETLPLILQYVRDDAEQKSLEVSRRVDLVEFPRMGGSLNDAERQTGHDHRKEMWRIGTAMETAALLLSKPRGRSLPVSNETAKRANKYLEAKPGESPILVPPVEVVAAATAPPEPTTPSAPASDVPSSSASSVATALPAWLRAPPAIGPGPGATPGVPVSTSDDPSIRTAAAPSAVAPSPGVAPAAAPAPSPLPLAAESPASAPASAPSPAGRSASPSPTPPSPPSAAAASRPSTLPSRPPGPLRVVPEPAAPRPATPPSLDIALVDDRVSRAVREAEGRWNQTLDARVREATEAASRTAVASRSELDARLATLDARLKETADASTRAVLASRTDVEARLTSVDARTKDAAESSARALVASRADLEARLTAIDARTKEAAELTAASIVASRADLEARVTAVDTRSKQSVEVTSASLVAARADLEARLAGIDARAKETAETSARTALTARSEVEARLRAVEAVADANTDALKALPPPVAAPTGPVVLGPELEERISEAVRVSSEGWAERFRRDLKDAADQISAQSASAEEELRAALVAQLDLEILEAKEQGTALREEIEGRVRAILQEHLDEAGQRTARDLRDSEQRLGLLVEGRTKDTETRFTTSLATHADRLSALTESRLAEDERRMALEQEARITEISEAQNAAVAGLQVRMQSFIEQRIREDQARAEEKYVELLARLKADLEQNLEHSLTSPNFDASMRERLTRIVEAKNVEQRKTFALAIATAEERVQQQGTEALTRLEEVETKIDQKEADLARVEQGVRAELDDLERRLMVVNEHVLPVVRETWLKVSQGNVANQEKELDARFNDLRAEFDQELRRLEGDSLQRSAELRDRLEASVATHGRIWLSLLRQLSPGGGLPPPAFPSSHRQPRRASRGGVAPSPPPEDRGLSDPMYPYPADPPNPMDPEPAGSADPAVRDLRRRPRRT